MYGFIKNQPSTERGLEIGPDPSEFVADTVTLMGTLLVQVKVDWLVL